MQADILRARKMESVGQLAGGIAHDFNNLLTVINGSTDLASTKLGEGDPLHADLEVIRRAGKLATSLTRQLLAFSRKQTIMPEIVNLRSLIAEMEQMLKRLIRGDITLAIAPGEGTGSVRADPGQIAQLVMNLAVNARDAMPRGGTLTIEVQDVELDDAFAETHPDAKPGPYVMLKVGDTGVGMDEATRLRIFEPFFTTKAPGRGTGLGLATVYGIVKQSGGSVSVRSEPGEGSVFTIHLPQVSAVTAAGHPDRAAKTGHGAETILVVEDEPAILLLAERVLQHAGYAVLTAGNGEEALSVLDGHIGPIHLLLTDVVMPGISGSELAARVADAHPEIKVLFTTGHTQQALLQLGVLNKDSHFIGKPYEVSELTRKVAEVLGPQGSYATRG
jgi:CheY-like chemotaxis protein